MTDTPRAFGRYVLFDEIGGGGMAKVHLGRALGAAGFSRIVAIKRIQPALACEPLSAAMLVDEARLAARIRHPNVVATLDVVNADGELMLVMEYVHGPSLAWLMRVLRTRGERAPLPIAMRIILDTLAGLHAAHEAKSERGRPLEIVHRDVSPHNVLVSAEGAAQLADFGIAKAEGKLADTAHGQIKGKLAYMAPEQLRGESLDRRADVFATGIILWELLTGRALFDASSNTVAAVARRLLEAHVEPPSRYAPVTSELEAIVMRALAAAPSARFETAQAMGAALEAVAPVVNREEVAAWVADVACDLLRERAALVAQIERSSEAFLPVAQDQGTGPMSAREKTATRRHRFTPSAPDETHLDPLTHYSVRAKRRRGRYGIAALLLLSIAASVVLLGPSRRAKEAAPRERTLEITTASAPVAAAAGAEAPEPHEQAEPLRDPAASSPSTSSPRLPSRSSPRHRPAPKAGRVDCDPPYSIDRAGVRVPRRECF